VTSADFNAIDTGASFAMRVQAAAMRWLIAAIVLVSMGAFSPLLIPESQAMLQQVAALGLWVVVIAASFFIAPIARIELTADAAAVLGLYGFAVISVLWSDLSAPTFMKGAAMSITTFGAYRLATRLSIDDILAGATFALTVLVGASIFTALFVPRIGVDDSWMHGGQWQGVFASKQALGIIAAHLLLFATYRKIAGGSWPVYLLLSAIALAGVIGSGSRGGGALALAAGLALYLCGRSVTLMRILAWGPLLLSAVACAMIFYIYSTGYDAFRIAGTTVDFTERTFIWQYALSHFNDTPVVGFGLNGFWTIKSLYDYFEQSHGWVLDNYHSGYIAILMETGLLGFTLFLGGTVLVAWRGVMVIRDRSMLRPHCTFGIVFLLLSYQINLTETNFLRSTSFMSILMIIVQLTLCSSPVRRLAAVERAP
jgi:exopolysaccharide production protein ExoQ